MGTTTIIYLLASIIVVLLAIVSFLIWRITQKNDELRQKNDVIVREVCRNQKIIDRAMQHGLNRSALL